MSGCVQGAPSSPEDVCAIVVAGLRSRGAEVAQAIYDSIPDPMVDLSAVGQDAEYEAGRAAAVAAIFKYSLDALERGGEWEPIPQALATQARRAARAGVKPGRLVRLYLAGHRRFMDFVLEEARQSGYADQEAVLGHLCGTHHALLEHIIVSLEREYDQECEHIAGSPEQRRIKLVRRLLIEDLDPVELKELGYEVGSSWHLGVIATGAKSWDVLRCLEAIRERDLLSVPGGEGAVWVWLGGRAELTVAEFTRLLSANGRPDTSLAIGEPRRGLEGWRETHREAQVALLVARHNPRGLTRCADALPVVGALQSEAIIRMYEKTYVLPLNELRKGGQPAREALRAYFKHGRSASTASEIMNVSRRTVENYLKDARKVLGDPLNLTGLEIALRLEELGYMVNNRVVRSPHGTDYAPCEI